jgi:hypothetical protein
MKQRRKEKGRINGPFVALRLEVLESEAWQAMSHGAQALYILLRSKAKNDASNNGRIFLSQRAAMKLLRSNSEQIARWFRELQHYGFLVQTKGGALGLNGYGMAAHWRLTELIHGYDVPTKEFLKWNGAPFVDWAMKRPSRKKIESRTGKGVRSVPERAYGPGTVVPLEPGLVPATVPERAYISPEGTVPEKAYITSIPSPSAPILLRLTAPDEAKTAPNDKNGASTPATRIKWSTPSLVEVLSIVEAETVRLAAGAGG